MHTVSDAIYDIVVETRTALQADTARPLLVAISGVQGCGKSTVCRAVATALESRKHWRTVIVSLDDFYRTHEELLELYRGRMRESRLYEFRGNPGTHDVALLADTLTKALRQDRLVVPRFEKSALEGAGDRLPRELWVEHEPPYDVILLEGWMLGFLPLNDDELTARLADPRLEYCRSYASDELAAMNAELAPFRDTIYPLIRAFVQIATADVRHAMVWRAEQEEGHFRRTRQRGMSPERVHSFVERFMPAYELYLPRLRERFVAEYGSTGGCFSVVSIDKNRRLE